MKEIFITDIEKAVIAGPVSRKGCRGSWRAVDYQTEEWEGVLIGQEFMTKPDPVTIELAAEGWYKIYLGFFKTVEPFQIRLRLTGDLCCTMFANPPGVKLAEVYWKDADLTGQDLIVENGVETKPNGLAFIRLVPTKPATKEPLTDSDIIYPLAVSHDGGFVACKFHRPEDILEELEVIRDNTCMKVLLWGIGGADLCNYPTKVGSLCKPVTKDYYDRYRERLDHNMNLLIEKGWDSLRIARDYAKKRGWEFQVIIRMETFAAHYPLDEAFRSKFYFEHPEYRCKTREGKSVIMLSYAYPEVQEHMLELFKEILEYNPDGLNLLFIRGLPVVLYEPIMIEGFKAKYGVDPRTLSKTDPIWMDYQSSIITPFIEKVKGLMKGNQRLAVTVPGNPFDLKRFGLDVATWVKEKLVDDIFPMGQRFTIRGAHKDAPESLDIEYFLRMQGRKRVRVFASFYPWELFRKDVEGWRRMVRAYLQMGCDGYFVWDGVGRHMDLSIPDINLVGDLGFSQPKGIQRVKDNKSYKLLRLGDVWIDGYDPWEVG